METFSALQAICAATLTMTSEFPAQMLVTRSFDVCFDLRLDKRLRKHCSGWWLRCHRAHYDIIPRGVTRTLPHLSHHIFLISMITLTCKNLNDKYDKWPSKMLMLC